MSIVLHNLTSEELLKELGYDADSPDELSECDIADFNRFPQLITGWYWYSYECYSGSGQILFRDNDNMWYVHGISHCSCNGPVDSGDVEAAMRTPYESLDAVMAKGSERELKELQPLVDAARQATSVVRFLKNE